MIHFLLYLMLFQPNQTWTLDCDTLSEPLSQVQHVIYGPDGQIYLHDFMEAQIYVISPQGKEVKRFGQKGQGPGEWQWGVKLVFSPRLNQLLLYDAGKHAWLRFQPDGTFIDELRDYDRDTLFVLDQGVSVRMDQENPFENPNQGCKIELKNKQETKILASFKAADHEDPTLLKRDNLQLELDLGDRKRAFAILSPDGSYLAFGSTSHLDVSILETNAFKPIGRVQADLPSFPISEDEKKERAESLNLNVNGGRLTVTVDELNIPDFRPPIEGVQFDELNRIWVRITPPYQADKVVYKVYDLKGRPIGTLSREKGFNFVNANKSMLLSYTNDEEEDTLLLEKHALKWD